MSIRSQYDVIVIGGGPSGMIAAGRAAERGLSVLLIEKNEILGKKLSITGGGRCNITNAEFNLRTFLKNYGNAEQFLYSAFVQFGVQDTFDFFAKRDLPLVTEERKRAFPHTQKAVDVTRVMRGYVTQGRVTVLYKTNVEGIAVLDGKVTGFVTNSGTYSARAYIIASGGQSHSETGSTGDSISWLHTLGHTTHDPNPNLVPLNVNDLWVRKLQGTTLTDVEIVFMQGKETLKRYGNVLCTHFGLSGPLVLNSALAVKTMLQQGPVSVRIDLLPDDEIGHLRTKLHALFEHHSNKTVANALKAWFPKGVVSAILETDILKGVGIQKVHSVERSDRHAIVDRIKSLSCTVTGTMGYDRAVVSDGGVDLQEVDTKTLRSKLRDNVYFVGDVLHINRPSGGYSLQLCWTTGWVAGNSVCA